MLPGSGLRSGPHGKYAGLRSADQLHYDELAEEEGQHDLNIGLTQGGGPWICSRDFTRTPQSPSAYTRHGRFVGPRLWASMPKMALVFVKLCLFGHRGGYSELGGVRFLR